MEQNKRLSSKVIEQLQHYVYVYVDPRDEMPFYVGKGTGNRCLTHLKEEGESAKVQRIKEIEKDNLEPRIDILVHGLPDAELALQVEAAAIDLIGCAQLTNEVRGWRSQSFGRIALQELVSLYDPREITIEEPSLLIRINQLFRSGMTDIELYDATRGIWRIDVERAGRIKLAFSVFQGRVREVYQITQWFPAGSSFSTRMTEEDDLNIAGRCEFVGIKAEEEIRSKYLDGSVAHYFANNTQSPFIYVSEE